MKRPLKKFRNFRAVPQKALSPDDVHIWQKVVATIHPLHSSKALREDKNTHAHIHIPPTPSPNLRSHMGDVQKRDDKNTRKGKIKIDTKIDLHDLTRAEAFPVLERKLTRAYNRKARTVLVVTGKGPNLEGVLRQNLPSWLGHASIRPFIAGYAHAHIKHGGMGAFYVFLKANECYPDL